MLLLKFIFYFTIIMYQLNKTNLTIILCAFSVHLKIDQNNLMLDTMILV